MKKIIALLLAVLMVLSMVACASKTTDDTPADTTPADTTPPKIPKRPTSPPTPPRTQSLSRPMANTPSP